MGAVIVLLILIVLIVAILVLSGSAQRADERRIEKERRESIKLAKQEVKNRRKEMKKDRQEIDILKNVEKKESNEIDNMHLVEPENQETLINEEKSKNEDSIILPLGDSEDEEVDKVNENVEKKEKDSDIEFFFDKLENDEKTS